jgi:hypothetical protein
MALHRIMSFRERDKKMKKVLLFSGIVWMIAIGLLYMEFNASPVKEFAVRGGQVIGEKGFLEARSAACTGITMLWLFILLGALVKTTANKGASQNQQYQTKPSGWYSDPFGRYEKRYWDGNNWTEQVSNKDQVTTDPPR